MTGTHGAAIDRIRVFASLLARQEVLPVDLHDILNAADLHRNRPDNIPTDKPLDRPYITG